MIIVGMSFLRIRLMSSLLLLGVVWVGAVAQKAVAPAKNAKPLGPALFAGFKNNGEDGVYFAISKDRYHWTLINDGKPVVGPTDAGELMRDPFVQRGPDGSFRMVWTWAWRKPAVLGYSSSKDLLHWEKHRQLDVMKDKPTAMNAWAPALYWDAGASEWLIFWSSTVPAVDAKEPVLDHRIYSTVTPDFVSFKPATIFFDPGYNVIDATILQAESRYFLVFKDERTVPLEKHILTAVGPTLRGPWIGLSEPFTETWSEGGAGIAVPGGYVVYYDHYRAPQHYGAAFSADMKVWKDVTGEIAMPVGMRHGSLLTITEAEYARLAAYRGEGAK